MALHVDKDNTTFSVVLGGDARPARSLPAR